MTFLEFLGTAGGTGIVGALGMIGKAAVQRRFRATESDPPRVEKRSYSPSGGVAAVRDDITDQRIEAATANATHTALLQRIADAVEKTADSIRDHRDDILSAVSDQAAAVREDLKTTRHAIRSDVQTVRLELAAHLGAEPRQRQPSAPGIGPPPRPPR